MPNWCGFNNKNNICQYKKTSGFKCCKEICVLHEDLHLCDTQMKQMEALFEEISIQREKTPAGIIAQINSSQYADVRFISHEKMKKIVKILSEG